MKIYFILNICLLVIEAVQSNIFGSLIRGAFSRQSGRLALETVARPVSRASMGSRAISVGSKAAGKAGTIGRDVAVNFAGSAAGGAVVQGADILLTDRNSG